MNEEVSHHLAKAGRLASQVGVKRLRDHCPNVAGVCQPPRCPPRAQGSFQVLELASFAAAWAVID